MNEGLCKWCEAPISQPETGRPREFCSDAHRAAWNRSEAALAADLEAERLEQAQQPQSAAAERRGPPHAVDVDHFNYDDPDAHLSDADWLAKRMAEHAANAEGADERWNVEQAKR